MPTTSLLYINLYSKSLHKSQDHYLSRVLQIELNKSYVKDSGQKDIIDELSRHSLNPNDLSY